MSECGYLTAGNSIAVGHGPADKTYHSGSITTKVCLLDGSTESTVEVDYQAGVSVVLGETVVEASDVEILEVRVVGTPPRNIERQLNQARRLPIGAGDWDWYFRPAEARRMDAEAERLLSTPHLESVAAVYGPRGEYRLALELDMLGAEIERVRLVGELADAITEDGEAELIRQCAADARGAA